MTAGSGRVHVDAPVEDQERLRELGEALGNAALVRVLETIGQAVVDMRGTDAADPRLVLEVALVRLTRRDAGPPLQTLIERIERLERAAAGGPGGGGPAAPATPSGRTGRSGGRAAAPAPESAPAPAETTAPAGASSSTRPALGALRTAAPAPESAPEAVADTGPAAPPAADTPSAPGREIELDDVIVAWAEILPELPMATRSAVQTAQPLRLEGAVIVFGVPPNLIDAAKPRFQRAADSIREAFSHRLGRTMKFKIEPADDFTAIGGAVKPGPRPRDEPPIGEPPADAGEPQYEAEEHIDLTETVDADTVDVAVSSLGLLEQQLGATVVEEKPRD